MKTMTRTLSLILGVLFLAGCASPCKKCNTEASQPAAPVAAPVVTQAAAPVAAAPAADEAPASVRRYVNK